MPPPDEPTDFDPPRVAAEVTDPANAEKVQAAAQKLTDQVAKLTPEIDKLRDDAKITFKNGVTMTGAEIKSWWRKADFLVTDRNNFGTDRGGAVIGTLSQFHFSTVNGWALHENGLSFIMIHEVMHMTQAAKDFDKLMWERHLAAGNDLSNYDGRSEYFRENERYVNDAAQKVLTTSNENIALKVKTTDPDPRNWVPPWGM